MTDNTNESYTNYTVKTKLSEGVTVFEDGNTSWGPECNHNFELLNEVLKPHQLTVKINNNTIGSFSTNANSGITFNTATDEQIYELI